MRAAGHHHRRRDRHVDRQLSRRPCVVLSPWTAGHEWPSFATQALWQFFAAH